MPSGHFLGQKLLSLLVFWLTWCDVSTKCQYPRLQFGVTPAPMWMIDTAGRWRRRALSGFLIPRFTLWKRLSNQWLIRHMCLCGRALCWRRELLQHPGHESFERQIHSVTKGTWERKGLPSPEWLVALMLLRKSLHIFKKESKWWLSNRSYVKCRGGPAKSNPGEHMGAFHLQGDRQLLRLSFLTWRE